MRKWIVGFALLLVVGCSSDNVAGPCGKEKCKKIVVKRITNERILGTFNGHLGHIEVRRFKLVAKDSTYVVVAKVTYDDFCVPGRYCANECAWR